jgi:hypothetical protein
MKRLGVVVVALLGLMGIWTNSIAQDDGTPPATASAVWTSADLDQMLGPIALYPDPLIGLILPASTFPSQIVMADRYIQQGGDPDQAANQPWDASVQGLTHYPTVLKWMDDNLPWTTQLGQAFASQQSDVMDAIQRLRAKAQALGNLQTTPQQTVDSDDGLIDIVPTDEDDLYVPDYDPSLIYYQPGVYCTFGIGFPIGLWLGYDWDWRHHHLISWGPGHERPHDWWHLSAGQRHDAIPHGAGVWHPQAGRAIVAGGGDRGYQSGSFSGRFIGPAIPSGGPVIRGTGPVLGSSGPVIPGAGGVVRPAERAPEVSRTIERSEPSESVFGGGESSREVRESSSRGEESRSIGGFGGSRSEGGYSGRR